MGSMMILRKIFGLLSLYMVLLSGCTATPDYLKTTPNPYRKQTQGIISGRLNPWTTNTAAWLAKDETDRYWGNLIEYGWTPLRDAEKADQRVLPAGRQTLCYSSHVMTISLLHSPRYWNLYKNVDEQRAFLLARDRVYADILARRNQEKTIRYGDDQTTAKARVARFSLFAERPYDPQFKPQPEDNFKDAAYDIERCRIAADNSKWLVHALTRGNVLKAPVSKETANAVFQILIQSQNDRDFVWKWLPSFVPFVDAGLLDANLYARHVDSYAIGTQQPQKYGSFMRCGKNIKGVHDHTQVSIEGLDVSRAVLTSNRARLKLEPFDHVEERLLKTCKTFYPFSM
jgi:hypothetical protein